MATVPARRTLGGLAPKASKQGGIDRLIKANRPAPTVTVGGLPEGGSAATGSDNALVAPGSLQETESVTNRVPKYLQLKRREARIYDEQADALTVLARRLNNQRKRPDGKTVGERITDNTLLRIAIDLLLERKEEIRGTTEQEIAENLGLEPRRLG